MHTQFVLKKCMSAKAQRVKVESGSREMLAFCQHSVKLHLLAVQQPLRCTLLDLSKRRPVQKKGQNKKEV